MSLAKVQEVALELRRQVRHYFTVNDLMYLRRGGRIGSSTAVMGTVLQIMPLMQLGETGALEVCGKIRGRRTALRAIADRAGAAAGPGTTVAVGHCDAPEDAAPEVEAAGKAPAGRNTSRRTRSLSGPLRRMMPIPPRPGAVAIAAIVSWFKV